jgi:hypothetical protein
VPGNQLRVLSIQGVIVILTEYAWMTSLELVEMVLMKADATALEIELAQRLAIAIQDDDDPRRTCQGTS